MLLILQWLPISLRVEAKTLTIAPDDPFELVPYNLYFGSPCSTLVPSLLFLKCFRQAIPSAPLHWLFPKGILPLGFQMANFLPSLFGCLKVRLVKPTLTALFKIANCSPDSVSLLSQLFLTTYTIK